MAENITFGPCVAEDAHYCYWNAPTMGNGQGNSFIALGPGEALVAIDGCEVGEGLPAVDFDADGTAWAYCEPALGNDVKAPEMAEEITAGNEDNYPPAVEVTEQIQVSTGTPEVVTDTLAVTGADDVSLVTVVIGVAMLVSGLMITLRKHMS